MKVRCVMLLNVIEDKMADMCEFCGLENIER